MADLDDESDHVEGEGEGEDDGVEADNPVNGGRVLDHDMLDGGPMDESIASSGDDSLLRSSRLAECFAAIEAQDLDSGGRTGEVYDLVVRCLGLVTVVEDEVRRAFHRLKQKYGRRFPELEKLLVSPLEYARVVSLLQNMNNLPDVQLASVLLPATVITVTVTASSTSGEPLSEAQLSDVLRIASCIIALEEAKERLLDFVKSRARIMAPNLCAVVGNSVAARLVGLAGGLKTLAMLPSCDLQVLGAPKRTGTGLSTSTLKPHEGVVYSCELMVELEPELRASVGRSLAAKCTLAARVDFSGEVKDGSAGLKFREDIERKIERLQEPPPAKVAKPLPIPGETKKNKRGGRRNRKLKELYGMSELRKQQNRMAFGKLEETYGNDLDTGFGMIGQDGSKKLRVEAKKTDSVEKAANRRLAKEQNRGGSGARAAGLTTTLTFSSGEGIQLGTTTPAPGGIGVGRMDASDGTKTNYFASSTPFLGLSRK